ncbi:hypothetical protein SELMODRAFT_426957 [Selaginella moellendorffii]|uniref:Uncharacterized protein n=1 Tax=Selaginella moellendorffii TaxID=88036 RepID=D8SY14_SELML|nr:hypothetical protein SELMODRAFT_426957 [Selaginella moellendorffii]
MPACICSPTTHKGSFRCKLHRQYDTTWIRQSASDNARDTTFVLTNKLDLSVIVDELNQFCTVTRLEDDDEVMLLGAMRPHGSNTVVDWIKANKIKRIIDSVQFAAAEIHPNNAKEESFCLVT